MRDPVQRDLEPDLLDDVGDVAPEQRQLDFLAVPAQIELLAEADRAKSVDARARRLAPPQQGQARAAAADLREQGPRPAEGGVSAELVADGQEHQAALFRFVDDVEGDAGARLDAVEEHVAVASFAHGARRDGADVMRRRSRS